MTIIQGGVKISGFVQFTANYEPGPPTALTATWTTTVTNTVSLQFTPPTNAGSGPVTSYSAVSNPPGFTATVAANTNTIVIPGLNSSTYYVFNMYATNFAGNSALSTASNVIYGSYATQGFSPISNYSVPSEPTSVTAIVTATDTSPNPAALIKFLPGVTSLPVSSFSAVTGGSIVGTTTTVPAPTYSARFISPSYLAVQNSSVTTLATGNFTIESWVYPTANNSGVWLGSWQQLVSPGDHGFQLKYGTGTANRFEVFHQVSNASNFTITSTKSYAINTWHHVAVVRANGVVTLYVNGVADGTASYSGNIIETQYWLGVTSPNYGTVYFNGYLSNVRIAKWPVYTGTFTPPAKPLTVTQSAGVNINAINTSSLTVLLTAQDVTFKDNSVNALTITPSSVSTSSTIQPFDTYGYIVATNLNPVTDYTFNVYASNLIGNSAYSTASNTLTTLVANSNAIYPFPGTYSWIAPANVTAVSAVVVGGGGGGSTNGNYGETGGDSYFISSNVVCAGGGIRAGLSTTGGAGGTVGAGTGFAGGTGGVDGGGGGAGGYTGVGGDGTRCAFSGGTGAGGAGGGGGKNTTLGVRYGGGGVGLFGLGANGAGGILCATGAGSAGGGGSGGLSSTNRSGGLFGGGGGSRCFGVCSGNGGGGGALAYTNAVSVIPGQSYTVQVGAGGVFSTIGGASGGARIIWPGQVRAFPSTVVSGCGSTLASTYVPKAPTIGTATANNGNSLTVTYTANTVLGSPDTTSFTAVVNPGNITSTVSTAGSYFIVVDGLSPLTTYSAYVYATNAYGNSSASSVATTATYVASSSTAYTFPGSYTWIAPADVTSVSAVVVGAGGGGCSSNGGASYFIGSTYLQGGGGDGAGLGAGSGGTASGTVTGRVGWAGGTGGNGCAGGGGGAGGYTAAGGGGSGTASGAASTGGGGGGGAGACGSTGDGGGGGGVGLFGLAGNGTGGLGNSTRNKGGGGGSGGQAGGGNDNTCNPLYLPRRSHGGFPGGGAGGGGNRGGGGGGALTYVNNYTVIPGNSYTVQIGTGGVSSYSIAGYNGVARGGNGAVRIMWPGQVRAFPSTQTGGCGATTSSTYVPQAPTIGTATANSGTMITVTYSAPTWSPSPITSYTGVAFPGGITSTTATSESGLIVFDGLTPLTTYSFYVYATNYYGNSTTSSFVAATTYVANSSSSYTFPGTYSWIAPANVTSVSAVAVGGGGGGGGNGTGGGGGNSTFISGATLSAGGGGGGDAGVYGGAAGARGVVNAGTGFGGGAGQTRGSGGGAGGYAGLGGSGGGGAGGGGGGGGYNSTTAVYQGGGGVGLFGIGGNGPLGATNSSGVGVAGGGGSGGLSAVGKCGGLFGGGGGGGEGSGTGGGGGGGALAYINNFTVTPGSSYSVVVGAGGAGYYGGGGSGGVRIVWPGQVRVFSTVTDTLVSGCGATTSSTYVPQAPTIGTAVANSGTRITITYSANSNGGAPITSYTAVTNPGNIITSTATGGLIVVDNVNPLTTYSSYVYANNQYGSSVASGILSTTTYVANGSFAYTYPGTYSWIAPANVTAVSIVAVGGGGGGTAGGCAIGGSYPAGAGGDSYFAATCIARAYGGTGASVGSSGSKSNTAGRSGTGLAGIVLNAGGNGVTSGAGGGAAGYAGAGGHGTTSASAASGGGGGGAVKSSNPGSGGGVGLFGLGPDGVVGGTGTLCNQAGSGGSHGLQTPIGCYKVGGQFGGGGAGAGSNPNGGPGGGLVYLNNYTVLPGNSYTVFVGVGGASYGAGGAGGGGAVRIVWPGQTRAFPNYNLVSGCGATTSSVFVPQAPAISGITANSGTMISVAYSSPAYNGGSPITSYTAVVTPGNITSTTATSGSSVIPVYGLSPLTTYSVSVYATNQYGSSVASSVVTTSTLIANGEALFTTPGTYSWVVPANVYSISAVAVGAGGDGGGAGNFACGGSGGQSYFVSTSTLRATGGSGGRTSNGGGCLGGAGGTVGAGTGFVGGKGGTGGGAGGGAGGYTAAGGAGGISGAAGTASTGGGGGGGGRCTTSDIRYGGGGVGLFGLGSNGAGGILTSTGTGAGGGGGSGGVTATSRTGGDYGGGTGSTGGGGGGGGGALSYINSISVTPGAVYTVEVGAPNTTGSAGGGAVRIVWPGSGRKFPSTVVS